MENITKDDEEFEKLFEYETTLHDIIYNFAEENHILAHRIVISLAKEIGYIIAAYHFDEESTHNMLDHINKIVKKCCRVLDEDIPS
jgi:hypothetical protein